MAIRAIRRGHQRAVNAEGAEPGAAGNPDYAGHIREDFRFRTSPAGCLSFIVRQDMNSFTESWASGAGPIESGVFFPDGKWIPVEIDELAKISVSPIQEQPRDLRFEEYASYENGRFEEDDWVVRWGGGPWEGEGWLALQKKDGDLKWLLHMAESEEITQARLFDDRVEAAAYCYPFIGMFTIPIEHPERIAYIRERER